MRRTCDHHNLGANFKLDRHIAARKLLLAERDLRSELRILA